MSDTVAAAPARNAPGYYALLALVAGLLLGMLADRLAPATRDPLLSAAGFIGGLWLNALKMTVVPLVVALLVTGIAQSAEAAQAGRIAARTVAWIVAICTTSAIFGALMISLLTGLFPLPRETAALLQQALAGIGQKAPAELPGVIDFFKGVIPDNVISAAANGDVLPLVVFALFFALALMRIAPERRRAIVDLFQAVAEALLVIIRWVLWAAPVGVLALAFTVGSTAGGAAFTGLGHYVLLLSVVGLVWTLCGYPLAILVGRTAPGRFARGMLAPQAVAISTRSSLASLPAMLSAAQVIGVRQRVADVVLPIAVALLRSTGPAMNVAVAFYVAHWLGLQPSVGQMIAATAVGAVMSYGAVSLPGEVSFISSIAPIGMALGIPIAPLGLLVAVEMIPDIFRTVGNVTMDVAVATVVDRSTDEAADQRPAMARTRSE